MFQISAEVPCHVYVFAPSLPGAFLLSLHVNMAAKFTKMSPYIGHMF